MAFAEMDAGAVPFCFYRSATVMPGFASFERRLAGSELQINALEVVRLRKRRRMVRRVAGSQ
jgi:hypothetical protein